MHTPTTRQEQRDPSDRPVYEVIAEHRAALAEYDRLIAKLEQQVEDLIC